MCSSGLLGARNLTAICAGGPPLARYRLARDWGIPNPRCLATCCVFWSDIVENLVAGGCGCQSYDPTHFGAAGRFSFFPPARRGPMASSARFREPAEAPMAKRRNMVARGSLQSDCNQHEVIRQNQMEDDHPRITQAWLNDLKYRLRPESDVQWIILKTHQMSIPGLWIAQRGCLVCWYLICRVLQCGGL